MKPYFKATLADGVSQQDPEFVYKIGMVVHPNPDRTSRSDCGVGIHLAKTINAAYRYVPKATEIYLAEPGVILGEDKDKVRCASCRIVRALTKAEIHEYQEEYIREKKWLDFLESLKLTTPPICGDDWLATNWYKVTQEDIDNQALVLTSGRNTTTIKQSYKRKDMRVVLKDRMKAG